LSYNGEEVPVQRRTPAAFGTETSGADIGVWQHGLGDTERTGALLHALAPLKLYNLARDIGEAHDLAAKEPGKLRATNRMTVPGTDSI
jgi:hypothetical protein